ncbi:MAG: phage holin family protein [Clostridiales bacterium]|jgi:toxin secretion/phage lysis holin|nr:phage holin family protein [Clostridiales bacterium]
MNEKTVKAGAAGISALLAYLGQIFTPLFFIMIAFEVLDYITGITAAVKKEGGLSSTEALWGFVKKACYFIAVGVAFLFDYAIVETAASIGIEYNMQPVFGTLSICYLLSTEGISIVENLETLGVRVPFLTSSLKAYRDKANSAQKKASS